MAFNYLTGVSLLIADVYSRVNFEGLQICPHFADFEFTNWTRNGDEVLLVSKDLVYNFSEDFSVVVVPLMKIKLQHRF